MEKEKLEDRICQNPHHSSKIIVNCVILCFEEKKLKVLLVKNKNSLNSFNWKLPNAILEGEPMLIAAQQLLKRYVPSDDFFLDQLKAFGYNSSLLQENISIAYYAIIRQKKNIEVDERKSDAIWAEINNVAYLDRNDGIILDFSLKELKKNICCSAVGFNLLAEKFTLLQVVQLYEEILGIKINKVNFRRKILQRKLVCSLDEKEEGVSYRAAKFYSLNVPKDQVDWNIKFNFIF